MQTTQELPPVEGGFEAPSGAPREEAGVQDVQGVSAPEPRATSPRQAAEAATSEAVKITPTRLREVAYQVELATKHRAKAGELLAAMTVGKSGVVPDSLNSYAAQIEGGEFDETRNAILSLADDLASL